MFSSPIPLMIAVLRADIIPTSVSERTVPSEMSYYGHDASVHARCSLSPMYSSVSVD